jgi:tRNA nucleotidyltransferase (CCA-adding enzyme)
VDIILTHENADFDAVAGLLAVARLYPEFVPVLPERINQNVARFLALYGGAFPFVHQADLKTRTIKHIILVDTQRMTQLKHVRSDVSIQIIDHHPANNDIPAHQTFAYELVGAVTTWLVEQIQQKGMSVSTLEATLMMLGIYEDTGSLAYGTTTVRDLIAASWLLKQQAVLDTVRRFLSPALSAEQQNLLELLLKKMETRDIQGYGVSVSAVSMPEYVNEVSSVAHRLRDLLDSAALFVVVEMPNATLLVARSTSDAINVGDIVRSFGGGGHGRAAAATIHDGKLETIVAEIWEKLETNVSPVVRVADLMSYGVQTVEAGQPLSAVIRRLRQIGHEGYPVVDAGKVVGLLTRRELDRADEHQMRELLVRDVMSAGAVTLTPNASVFELERTLVDSGWGQIPIVDDVGKLIGIVTRTDLLKYWAKSHPSSQTSEHIISIQQFETVLGKAVTAHIQMVAELAQRNTVSVYLVGGVVRDLLLGRANYDIDFVAEGNAITLAEGIQKERGGHLTVFKPFGTAKWKPEPVTNETVDVFDHLDFASARYEFYEHPTALPTVYESSIKLDLQRRDFTINTLAIQISPASLFGRVVDFYGGLRDLEARLIRVLHSLSFIDDPTRILRALRFEHRLGFKIEARTAELITTSLPMLGRITGERLRNELTLMLKENQPERGLMNLQKRGVLAAIHPTFVVGEKVSATFQRVRSERSDAMPIAEEQSDLYWHVWLSQIEPDALKLICERLLFGRKMSESLLQAAELVRHVDELAQPEIRPSAIVNQLQSTSELALLAAWYISEDKQVRDHLQAFWSKWRLIQSIATGETLRQMGLKAGPCYRVILTRLRQAWLDELVQNEMEERQLLNRLIHEERLCDDHT